MYKVFKDHAELAEYKTLAAAKKLAEKQNAVVFHNGEQVYPAQPTNNEEQPTSYEEQPTSYDEQADDVPDSTGAIQPQAEDNTGRYRIESLMNVRLHPALNADIVGIAQPGTIVTVTGIDNDWMAVKNGNETVYVLYGGGRYATRL